MADFDAGTVWTPGFHYGGASETHAAGSIYTPGFHYGGSIEVPPATDTTGPSISADVVGGDITPTQLVQVTAEDESGIAGLVVYVDHADGTELVVEYSDGSAIWGDSFAPGGIATPALEVTVDVLRTGGWPWLAFTLRAVAVDAAGNVSRFSRAYTVPDAVEPPTADVVPPEIANVTPAPGTPITTTTPVSFEVTDDQGEFRRILVAVEISGVVELAHDGEDFLGNYAGGGCTRDPIAGGFAYTLLRDGGWPSSPTLRVWAIDLRGNEAP